VPSLTQLEYVLAVDRHRHFGKAAKASFVTQPTLSQQLQKLEDELGIVLFDRTKKPILPTQAGKLVIEQARIAVAEFKKIALLARQDDQELSGEFSLAVIPTLAPYLIPLFIEKFSKLHPKVNLHIEELQTAQILRALDQDEIDAGLLVTPLGQPGFEEDVLFYEPFYLYLRRDHPLAKKEKMDEKDMDGSELWLLKEGHCFREQMIRICSLDRKSSVLKNVTFESGNLETLKRLVDLNGGYTLLPYLAAIGRAGVGSLVKPFNRPVPSREVSFAYRRLQLKRPVLAALKAVILEVIPDELRKLKPKDLEVVGISA